MAFYLPLPQKERFKVLTELVELHNRCIKSYLIQRQVSVRGRNKFSKLYNVFIDESNILCYFYIPVNIFVQYMVKGDLKSIFNRYPNSNISKSNGKKPKRKNNSRVRKV